MKAVAWAALVFAALMAASVTGGCRADGGGVGLGDFEDGTTQGWRGGAGAKAAVSDRHAVGGAKSLRADLPAAPYPGVGLELRGATKDWSHCLALRLAVFNPSGDTVTLCVRVDDDDSTRFPTRYNNDMYPHRIKPGANDVEVTVAALRQGSFGARGLDVRRIREVRIFAVGLKKPVVLHFDDFHLVPAGPGGPREVVLADFDKPRATWRAEKGAAGRVVAATGGAGGDALELTLGPEGDYPGLVFTDLPGDWLDFDLLTMDLSRPAGAAGPDRVSVKVTDTVGRRQTANVTLAKGLNRVAVPMDVFSAVSLGKVASLQIFTGRLKAARVLHVDNVALRRVAREVAPTVHGPADGAALTLDMTEMKVPRNTCFLATVHVPLADGCVRVVRCNSSGKDVLRYSLPAEALRGHDRALPVRVWLYVSDHGVWVLWPREVRHDGQPTTVKFIAGH